MLHHRTVENVNKSHLLLPAPSRFSLYNASSDSLSLFLPLGLLLWKPPICLRSGALLFGFLSGSHLASSFLSHPLVHPRSPWGDQPHQQKENEVSRETDPLKLHDEGICKPCAFWKIPFLETGVTLWLI